MRGTDTFTESLFTMRKLEDFIPAGHPLRAIRIMANTALEKMNGLFSEMYEADIEGGRGSELRYIGHTLTITVTV